MPQYIVAQELNANALRKKRNEEGEAACSILAPFLQSVRSSLTGDRLLFPLGKPAKRRREDHILPWGRTEIVRGTSLACTVETPERINIGPEASASAGMMSFAPSSRIIATAWELGTQKRTTLYARVCGPKPRLWSSSPPLSPSLSEHRKDDILVT